MAFCSKLTLGVDVEFAMPSAEPLCRFSLLNRELRRPPLPNGAACGPRPENRAQCVCCQLLPPSWVASLARTVPISVDVLSLKWGIVLATINAD